MMICCLARCARQRAHFSIHERLGRTASAAAALLQKDYFRRSTDEALTHIFIIAFYACSRRLRARRIAHYADAAETSRH